MLIVSRKKKKTLIGSCQGNKDIPCFFQNLKDESLDLGCEDYLHKCFFKIESIVAGDFVLKTTGDFESQSAFAGADFFFSGLQIIFNNTAKPITYNKDSL